MNSYQVPPTYSVEHYSEFGSDEEYDIIDICSISDNNYDFPVDGISDSDSILSSEEDHLFNNTDNHDELGVDLQHSNHSLAFPEGRFRLNSFKDEADNDANPHSFESRNQQTSQSFSGLASTISTVRNSSSINENQYSNSNSLLEFPSSLIGSTVGGPISTFQTQDSTALGSSLKDYITQTILKPKEPLGVQIDIPSLSCESFTFPVSQTTFDYCKKNEAQIKVNLISKPLLLMIFNESSLVYDSEKNYSLQIARLFQNCLDCTVAFHDVSIDNLDLGGNLQLNMLDKHKNLTLAQSATAFPDTYCKFNVLGIHLYNPFLGSSITSDFRAKSKSFFEARELSVLPLSITQIDPSLLKSHKDFKNGAYLSYGMPIKRVDWLYVPYSILEFFGTDDTSLSSHAFKSTAKSNAILALIYTLGVDTRIWSPRWDLTNLEDLDWCDLSKKKYYSRYLANYQASRLKKPACSQPYFIKKSQDYSLDYSHIGKESYIQSAKNNILLLSYYIKSAANISCLPTKTLFIAFLLVFSFVFRPRDLVSGEILLATPSSKVNLYSDGSDFGTLRFKYALTSILPELNNHHFYAKIHSVLQPELIQDLHTLTFNNSCPTVRLSLPATHQITTTNVKVYASKLEGLHDLHEQSKCIVDVTAIFGHQEDRCFTAKSNDSGLDLGLTKYFKTITYSSYTFSTHGFNIKTPRCPKIICYIRYRADLKQKKEKPKKGLHLKEKKQRLRSIEEKKPQQLTISASKVSIALSDKPRLPYSFNYINTQQITKIIENKIQDIVSVAQISAVSKLSYAEKLFSEDSLEIVKVSTTNSLMSGYEKFVSIFNSVERFLGEAIGNLVLLAQKALLYADESIRAHFYTIRSTALDSGVYLQQHADEAAAKLWITIFEVKKQGNEGYKMMKSIIKNATAGVKETVINIRERNSKDCQQLKSLLWEKFSKLQQSLRYYFFKI